MQDIRIDLYQHPVPDYEVLRRLEVLSGKIDLVLLKENIIMSMETDALDQAEAAATANAAADDSAEQLLITLSKMVADLKANTTDPATVARITALATAISSRASQLGTAVAANTPAAVTP
jgi:hypothetical protein